MSRETDLAECEAAMRYVIRKLDGLVRKAVEPRPEFVKALELAETLDAQLDRCRKQ